MGNGFLEPRRLRQAGPQRMVRAIQRLLAHLGFDDIRYVDGPGDAGADILAVRGRARFVVQSKWTTHATIDKSGVDELERAKAHYSADRAALVTNAQQLSPSAEKRRRSLERVGVTVEVWTGPDLEDLYREMPIRTPQRFRLRPYQEDAIRALQEDLDARNRALLILATGLGKTVVGGELIAAHISAHPSESVLVVAHLKELVQQLERALWQHLPKWCPTQVLTGEERPVSLNGVTCATVESALRAVESGYGPSLVMVDETHHVAESGQFQKLLDLLVKSRQFGVTATPWRGDLYDLSERFGRASFKMGIAEGMASGFLSQVDYRLFVDNIDWEAVHRASERGYSVKELNESLFVPQRDEAIVDRLLDTWRRVREPRAIVFCQTIKHAERVATLLSTASPNWRRAASIHSRLSKRDRDVLMADFRLGRVPIITARDVLNEGVDVPDVNIICFLRVTHSRRIFVQQLGRGLRIRPGKERVEVIDFVTDIRRVAATLDLKRTLRGLQAETVTLPGSSTITFSDARVGELLELWIQDAASLETAADEVKLQFPDIPSSIA